MGSHYARPYILTPCLGETNLCGMTLLVRTLIEWTGRSWSQDAIGTFWQPFVPGRTVLFNTMRRDGQGSAEQFGKSSLSGTDNQS